MNQTATTPSTCSSSLLISLSSKCPFPLSLSAVSREDEKSYGGTEGQNPRDKGTLFNKPSGWLVCLELFEVVESDYEIHASAGELRTLGYRFGPPQTGKSGLATVWHDVTPWFLGWMQSQIERQLRRPPHDWPEDLARSIALFEAARDLSGVEPAPSAVDWMPPGLKVAPPLEWPDESELAETAVAIGKADPNRQRIQIQPLPGFVEGDRVRLVRPIDSARVTFGYPDSKIQFQAAAVYRDGRGAAVVDLSNGRQVVLSCLPAERVEAI